MLFTSLLGWQPAARGATVIHDGAVTAINGPDGLDLAGEFIHAINFSANDPALTVKGVRFRPDTAIPSGFTVGNNQVAPWQARPSFGDTVDDNALEQLFEDIRYCLPANGQSLQAHLPVTSGETYKIQLLFYGNGTENRRWDIEVEGVQTVDEITSLGVDLPAYSPNTGIVYTYTVTMADSTLDIRMGNFGEGNDGGDRNAIWQALTVEHIVPDSDNDGLPDAYELAKFGTLDGQSGSDDTDGDGLSNQVEYQLGTNPKAADTDGDGFSDGEEYLTRKSDPFNPDADGDGLFDGAEVTAGTDPALADTDGDGLSDGDEVNVFHTNPLKADSDDDGSPDGAEVSFGSNPMNAAEYPVYGPGVNLFTGGDKGEGLDLDGTFPIAARFGVSSLTGSWQVRDAVFQPYNAIPGLIQDAQNEIGQWINIAFPGAQSTDDTNLKEVVRSIRYGFAAADPSKAVHISLPGLVVGRSYKLQLIFAESCCANRGFDVYVNDVLVADEFAPGRLQGNVGTAVNLTRGSVVSYGFIANSTTAEIRLDKSTITTAALNDPNPIINALTLEEITTGPNVDPGSTLDSLPDDWEVAYFGNVSQGDHDDFDNDGLDNLTELLNGTDPSKADTDGDGLSDSQELNVYHTNPRVKDTDRDGLSDGQEVTLGSNPLLRDSDGDTLTDGDEVNIYHTDPTKLDSDGDGVNDLTEIQNGSNPASAASTPGATYVTRVYGADPGEGLDLTGTFLYAFNVGTNGSPGQILDANFTDDSAPGISISAPQQAAAFDASINFGIDPADAALATVFKSIRWANTENVNPDLRNVKVQLTGLTVGQQYKLQLLFGEGCCPARYFDVFVEGNPIVHEFHTAGAQGGIAAPRLSGSAIVHTFTAASDTLHIVLDGTRTLIGADGNAILSGLTLEAVTTPVELDLIGFTHATGSTTIQSRGTPGKTYSVDFSTNLTTWEEVWDSLVPDAGGNASWTDTNATRTGAVRSFYRVRDPVLKPAP